jgi:hypothetical protein
MCPRKIPSVTKGSSSPNVGGIVGDAPTFAYPVLSKELVTILMGSPKEYQEYVREKEIEWNKTHKWIEPICAKCHKRTSSCGKVGILKTEKYYCARCSAKPTSIETDKLCICLIKLLTLLENLNLQLWTDDAHSTPTIECPIHHTTASFTFINQYD